MQQVPHTVSPHACWIGPASWQDQVKPDVQSPYALRKVFSLDQSPKRVTLNITAAWRYNLWINGTFIHHGPARAFPEHMLYDTLDVTAHVQQGDNVIAVLLIPCPGVPGYTPVTRSGLWVEGNITTMDNQSHPLVSDTSWQMRKADWINFHHLFISLAVGQQEHFDATRVPRHWKTDPSPSLEGWRSPMLLGTHPTPPWWNLSARPHALLTETPITAKTVWQGTLTEKLPELPDNPAIAFNQAKIDEQVCEPCVQSTLTIEPKQIITLDFGHTQLIRPGMVFEPVDHPARLCLFYDITMKERPTAMTGFGTEREGFCDSITISDNELSWHAQLARGFRFMTLCNTSDQAITLTLDCHVVTYPFDEPVTPDFSESWMRDVWDTSVRTLRSSCFDAIVDTCSREQMCWTLDACLAGEATYVTFGECSLWRRCLQLIGQGIDEHGCPRAVVPADVSFMVLFDQTLYWLVSCERYVAKTMDRSLIDEIAEPAERLLTLCRSQVTSEKLFVPPDYSWHFVDWAPIPRMAYSMPINAMMAWACDAAIALYDSAIGKVLSPCLRDALQHFFDDAAGCYRNHNEPKVDVGVQSTFNHVQHTVSHGIHANGLALQLQLPGDEHRKRVNAWMLKQLAEPFTSASVMGPGWVALLLEPLVCDGHGDAVQDYLRSVHGRYVKHGVPTWPEGFGGNESVYVYNTAHGWGAAVNVLIKQLMER